MRALKNIFQDIRSSFYNPDFYQSLRKRTVGRGVRFLFFVLVVYIIFLIMPVVFFIPDLVAFSRGDYFEKIYPDELVITVTNGEVSSNVPEPYIIPNTTPRPEEDEEYYTNLFVIDTSSALSLDAIQAYDAYIVLTKKELVARTKENKLEAHSLEFIKEFTLDENTFLEFKDIVFQWGYALLLPATILVLFFMSGFSLAYHLFLLLIGAGIPLLLSRLEKSPLTYREAYLVSLYAVVPVILIDIPFRLIGFGSLPSSASILFFILFVFINLHRSSSPAATVSP